MSNRFYVEQPLPSRGKVLLLDAEESHHLLKVMRCRPGDRIRVFHNGCEAWAALLGQEGKQARLEIQESVQPPAPARLGFHAIIPMLRGGKTEWIVQKLTELGVRSICVFHGRREVTQGSADKLSRLRKVMIEACKQCERADIPGIAESDSLRNAFVMYKDLNAFPVLLHEREGGLYLGTRLRELFETGQFPPNIVCASGPEGGFDPAELQFDEPQPEFVTLGARILRADTAPLVAFAAALAIGNEL